MPSQNVPALARSYPLPRRLLPAQFPANLRASHGPAAELVRVAVGNSLLLHRGGRVSGSRGRSPARSCPATRSHLTPRRDLDTTARVPELLDAGESRTGRLPLHIGI